jgi:hypothetical protein
MITTPAQNLAVLSTQNDDYPLLERENVENMVKVLRQNVGRSGASTLDLPRIKVTAGDTLLFKLTSPDGDETAKELEGIIVAWRLRRLYWKQAQASGQKKPPDCVSQDSLTGVGDPGGECNRCPYAEFGSAAVGRGQACKQIRQLLLMCPGNNPPYLVTVPPTSLKSCNGYFMKLGWRRLMHWGVVTQIKLEKAENEAGIAYGRMLFSLKHQLTPAQQQAFYPCQQEMEKLLDPIAVTSADYETAAPAGPQGLKSYPRSWQAANSAPEDAAEPTSDGGGSEVPF